MNKYMIGAALLFIISIASACDEIEAAEAETEPAAIDDAEVFESLYISASDEEIQESSGTESVEALGESFEELQTDKLLEEDNNTDHSSNLITDSIENERFETAEDTSDNLQGVYLFNGLSAWFKKHRKMIAQLSNVPVYNSATCQSVAQPKPVAGLSPLPNGWLVTKHPGCLAQTLDGTQYGQMPVMDSFCMLSQADF